MLSIESYEVLSCILFYLFLSLSDKVQYLFFSQTQNLLPNYEDAVKDTPHESPPPYTSN